MRLKDCQKNTTEKKDKTKNTIGDFDMNLYEINQQLIEAINNSIDSETGEITGFDTIQELQLQREEKIKNIGLYLLEIKLQAKQVREIAQKYQEKAYKLERRYEKLTEYLQQILNGEKFKSAEVNITERESKQIQVDDDFIKWAQENAEDLLNYKEPTVNKSAIKEAIRDGRTIEHAKVKIQKNLIIK